MDRRPLLVTDGETRAALATTRSLGRAGHEVHVVSSDGRSLAGASRHCRAEHALGDPQSDPAGWAERVIALAARLEASVFPISEVSIGSLLAARGDARSDLIAASRADYEAAIDKHTLLDRAARSGIEVPRSCLVPDFGALRDLPTGLDYPIVAKPRRSRCLTPQGWVAPPIDILRNATELHAAADRWRPEHGEILLQEFIPGHGEGLFALCRNGEIVACFAHRRLREKPPRGGVSVLRESIAIALDLGEASSRLLAELRFTGLAMVEYRRAPNGRLVLMEINPRPWGSLQLAIDAGVDFPLLWLAMHRNPEITTSHPPTAELGVRTRWLLGDVDHWLACARSRALRRELGKSLARITLEFVTTFFDGSRLEVLRLDDPRPFGRELAEWIVAPWRDSVHR